VNEALLHSIIIKASIGKDGFLRSLKPLLLHSVDSLHPFSQPHFYCFRLPSSSWQPL